MLTALLVTTVMFAPPVPVPLDDAARAKLKDVAFQAAREGDCATLKEYFAAGFAANDTTSRGDTLLTLAVYYGHTDAVELILKQPKSELKHRNKMGFTALDGAAFKGSVPIAKLLTKAGADANAANEAGKTPLMLAALTGRTEMVKYLLEAGAKPNTADKDGNTALKLAQTQGATEVIKLLETALAKR